VLIQGYYTSGGRRSVTSAYTEQSVKIEAYVLNN